ncbi:hypothetical protein F383_31482 [Gossypium arboreum]|uniref:Uncharacterized protein n=1 Tax=Gossypium arboreum TaxID=29729 RepID=A0A0B0PGW5_GOSAR|nr:hypothetical protein F383_31482 [Gossypium arboreum]
MRLGNGFILSARVDTRACV